MASNGYIKYYGWSALELRVDGRSVFFDPFFRPYCGAHWFDLPDFAHADIVCVTHGHEEHFLDVPAVVAASGARVVATPAVCRFLARRNGVPEAQLRPIGWNESVSVEGFEIGAFAWKHRDINLVKAMTKAVFHGNATQLAWAWSSATNAPFYAGYTGYHVRLPDGTTVLNYNEGFNSKTTGEDLAPLAARYAGLDVLLAGMQLDFVADVVRGVETLGPRVVMLYPPHEKFHEMMEVRSTPWEEFARAVRAACPDVRVVVAEPGTVMSLDDFSHSVDAPRRLAA
jgi:L-ascorbate metabolism protein UlaG (beta-lactamase superfamily)